MANAFTAALGELQACQSAEFGTPCVATIGTQEVAAVILDDPLDNIIAPDGGGETQGGQQTIMVNKALLTSFANEPKGWPPHNITPTVVLGVEAFVLGVVERLGVLYITTGFPAAGDSE